MKKLIAVAGVLLLGIGVLAAISFSKGGVMVDRLNPLIEVDDYYTVVTKDGKYLGKDNIRKDSDSYEYKFTGFNSKGKKQSIVINVTKKLRHGAVLKIQSKGMNGKYWEEVQPKAVPEKAKVKLAI